MATVKFSVPDDVQQAFDAAFEGQDKSAVIAGLMLAAVERTQHSQQLSQQHRQAVGHILASRATAPPVTKAQVTAGRHEDRA